MSPLRILVVGGFTRLDPFYREAPLGLEVDTIFVDCPSLEARAAAADAIVLVATNVSHSAAAKVRIAARRYDLPLEQAMGPSVSRVRAAIGAAFIALSRPAMAAAREHEEEGARQRCE